MHTFADLAQALNRSTVYLTGLQSRFKLPKCHPQDRGASFHALYHRGSAAGFLALRNEN